MIYNCCVRQKKCRRILKHVLKRCDNRKSCRRPVASLSHATKSYRVNRPLDSNDQEVADQRFSLKQWFVGGSQSRGLRKPGCSNCYLRFFRKKR